MMNFFVSWKGAAFLAGLSAIDAAIQIAEQSALSAVCWTACTVCWAVVAYLRYPN